MNTPPAPVLDKLYRQFLASHAGPLQATDCAALLKQAREQLNQLFEQGQDIHSLLHEHTGLIDRIVCDAWNRQGLGELPDTSLIAVGGYGRCELHPASDIDLLILLGEEPGPAQAQQLSDFLTLLWDMGLEVGHSVRTLEQCLEEAEKDLTVITNLLESRFLCGDENAFFLLRRGILPHNMWDSERFFRAKLEEKRQRYLKFGDTAYRVEPNLKEGPGGLRDIHMISWILEREYGRLSLLELHERNLLEREEYETLREGRAFLWRVRFKLHSLTGRKEDRLLFDYQHTLAESFGYPQGQRNEAVEAFMQHYYKTITQLERLTDVLLGYFQRKLLQSPSSQPAMVGEWYVREGTLLAVNSPDTFVLYPTALLEIFLILQTTRGLSGLAPETIRLMRHNLHRIDAGFRSQAWHRQIFMQILRQSSGVTHVFRLMNRYGVLAAYLPPFANIVGRMQYDLFHAYTVDEHTLMVLSNVRRYSTEKGTHEIPLAGEVFRNLPRPELLYLAALFHDIAKGRNGDHSVLGAEDAYLFSREHGLNLHDSLLVKWLVRNHLLLSMTAQRKDISDPAVLQEFATQVVEQNRLDSLFLLTIADIKGTNPKLWNSWKQSLLTELYLGTRKLLRKHAPLASQTDLLLQEKRGTALEELVRDSFSEEQCQHFWAQLGEEYLLQHSVESICWHARHILTHSSTDLPLVELRTTTSSSSNVIFVYSEEFPHLFSRVVSSLEQLNLNIVQARLVALEGSTTSLYTLHVLGPDNTLITTPDDQQRITATIRHNLGLETYKPRRHRQRRILRNFDVPTRISFHQNPDKQVTLMEVNTGDMPGLLSRIGAVLDREGIRVHSAQISTLGEQAEDVFHITTRDGRMVDQEALQQQLENSISEAVKH
ncbi:MAG: [protein-PII] uridylyltransferase [Thiothrix sp.]|nr:[protein-PII] uridylyltransferase [Thiothrix sp.]HPQ94043.1 [protein-PII] uridylyltransferase [Thiolinea sp.]